ncbi:hypothetical protein ZHAS_00015325 [Anopheles sinensis]|uniref:Serendipity locus protein alpha n=1 Tax=Anopheles sinensis TaxID=74873 RepID=A0A084WAQ1_ANOSI|nr:hypothetical protein ZHAS_00015325 [Anopheles sinensis]
MLPELQECITKTQDNLYRGYVPTDQSGLQWLDSVCADLHRLFRIVHKYLMFEQNGNVGTLETCFLCISQIVTCIRWLEKTITMELKAGKRQGLPQSRQCFLDRIIWCLERLKAVLETDVPCEAVTESNFVSYLDLALSLISPLTVASDEDCTEDEYDRQYNAVLVESGRIRSIIEALITQTFGFCNVLPEEDRKRITNFCQKVLKECLALERESNERDSNSKKLRVSILESAIYQLEKHVNECLLRLVYETFGDTDRRLLSQLRENITSTASEDELDGITQPFDEYVERLMQIGLFAISYADNLKLCSAIRSSLASIEALDSYLIPSLYMGTHNNTILLEQHWLEESDILCKHVHKIIDTNAFALALIEQLDAKLDEFETDFKPTEGLEMARKVEIFLQHLEVNANEVKLHEEPLKLYYADYRTMTLECRAIVKCAQQDDSIDPRRVIKRFRVLLGKLRKIQLTISNKKGGKVPLAEETASGKPSTVEQGSSPAEHEVEESVQELYVASQLRMSSANILYRSRRGEPIRRRLEASSLLEINTFTDILDHRRKRAETSPEKGSIRRKPIRRNSLRVAMFKKQQRVQTAEMYDSMQSDIDLQITEILDELTDLSNTFSTQTPRISNPKVTNPPDTAVRKSIANEEIAVVDGNKIRIHIFTDI